MPLELTEQEIVRVTSYLAETRDLLIDSTSGLSSSQWNCKAAADCWSIAEIVEHMALIEQRVHHVIRSMPSAPEAPAEWSPAEMDSLIPEAVPQRSGRVQAPDAVQPRHGWSGEEAKNRFLASRLNTMELVTAPALRGHVVPHPVFGAWDGYHWLLATAAHSERHIRQIEEVKRCAEYLQCAAK